MAERFYDYDGEGSLDIRQSGDKVLIYVYADEQDKSGRKGIGVMVSAADAYRMAFLLMRAAVDTMECGG